MLKIHGTEEIPVTDSREDRDISNADETSETSQQKDDESSDKEDGSQNVNLDESETDDTSRVYRKRKKTRLTQSFICSECGEDFESQKVLQEHQSQADCECTSSE